ncbi:MAG: tetratricopeptide repeat protein [Psychromonas sp.]|nr:tetratricopeptide repeat protein [Psychromonas sp.]
MARQRQKIRKPKLRTGRQDPYKNKKAGKLLEQGLTLHQNGQLAQAKVIYERVLLKEPRHFDALHLLGVVAVQSDNSVLALELISKAIKINPNVPSAQYNQGIALKNLGYLDKALASYDKAISLKYDYAEAFFDRAITLHKLNRLVDSLASYDAAIAINPNYGEAFNNRGNTLRELDRLDESVASYDKAIAIKPNYADAFYNRGISLKNLNRLDEAVVSYDNALILKPDYVEVHYNRGNVLQDVNRFEEALACYNKAIAIKPDHVESYINCGITLNSLERFDEALASYNKAISIKADNAEAFSNRGNTLVKLKCLEEAFVSYNKSLTIKPDSDFLFGTKLHTQMNLCDWANISAQLSQLLQGLIDRRKIIGPFPLLGLLDKPALQLQATQMYVNTLYPSGQLVDDLVARKVNKKIRIGYYSADFYNHATAYLMVEFFETHDRQKFEIYGFSLASNENDEMCQRVVGAFDHFYEVANKRDGEVTKMSRELGIDIAVDLKGFTKNARTGIFAKRCAPIQVNYLGYPGTMAASYIDYIIADKILIPQESQQYYREKIVYMPSSYQVNDSKREISDKILSRKDVGLPSSGFVFCCFNNSYKILPATFNGWMRILKAVDHSVLWLLECYPAVVNNLRKEAQVSGVDPNRLIFAKKIKIDDHLARHQLADLFIDTLPCNAHTTASDALWAGLPVLTLIGICFAGRVAASLLNAMDLSELITGTQVQYESKAIELANNPKLLSEIKKKLERNRLTSSLFNGEMFARNIETAFTQMYQRYQSGQVPENINLCALQDEKSPKKIEPMYSA